MTYSIGIDVSGWDPILSWKNYTWDYAFVKASEGTIIDRRFYEQWKAAKGHTIRSAYHFFRPRIDVKAAAQRFVDIIAYDKGELPPVLDLEVTDNMSDTSERALLWLSEVERMTKRTPIVYTAFYFANSIGMYRYPEFARYPIWQAGYPYDKISDTWSEAQRESKIASIIETRKLYFPVSPRPFPTADFVQWTAKCLPQYVPGYPTGIKYAVDVNFFHGDVEQLKKEYRIGSLPKPEGGGIVPDQTVTLTATLRELQPSNLREAAGLSAPVIKTLVGPLQIQGIGQKTVKDGYHWIQIISPQAGWVALTTSYADLVWNVPTTNPRYVVKSVLHYNTGETQELSHGSSSS